MLPSIAQIARASEGQLVIEDLQNFGAYYDRTLMAWKANVDMYWDELSAAYDERFRRMWDFYLLSSAGSFRARTLQLYQFVMSRDGLPSGYEAENIR
jgi:cyclopropane-fatty-acyl-phospholipid synthase